MINSEPNDPRLNWSALSQAERDAAYDNNKAVANSPALIAVRNATSAKVRALHPGTLDVAYGTGERTKFDLYPAKDGSAPCLVFLHGGYWQRNSRQDFAMMIEGLAAHGWSVVIPGYSLAPQASLTQIVQEISLALDWLAANGASRGIAGPIVLSGWSAGAQLAALTLHHPVVTAGLAISGVYDLARIRDTSLNAALRLTDEEIAKLSPLRLPVVQKPLAIAYGSAELPALAWDSRNFREARNAAGAPGELVVVNGADHFTVLEELRRADGALTKVALSLVG
jgi:acetyl esterase/lipase